MKTNNIIDTIGLMSMFCIISMIGLLSSCESNLPIGCISPDGANETRVVTFDEFDALEIEIDCNLEIIEGATQEVTIVAASNVIDRLIDDSNVSNNQLQLEINGCNRIEREEITVTVTIPSLTEIEIDGDANIFTRDIFENVEDLILSISGDGEIDLDLREVSSIEVDIDGDGAIDLTGTAEEANISIDGDGELQFEDLVIDDCVIEIDGDGKCEVNVAKSLGIEIDGDGEVRASGTASELDIDVSGDASVEAFDLLADKCTIKIDGDGDCEVNVVEELSIDISGSGKVCYQGNPALTLDIDGDAEVTDCN